MNDFNYAIIIQAAPYLWQGLQFSLLLTGVTFVGGMILGTGLALAQHLSIPILSAFSRVYVVLMRSIPLILVLFWFFFLVPLLLAYFTDSKRPVPIGPVYSAYITFILFESAYYCEIIRVGLRSLSKGQYEACHALGLSRYQAYRDVILPQVLRVVSPIVLSQTIILFQDTSLVYVLSLTDLLGAASKVAQLNGRLVEMYLTVAAVYLIICWLASQYVAVLRRRTAARIGK